MKPNSKEDIQSILRQIESGSFNRRDIKLLFCELRPYLKNGESLKDIANFVAHPENRKQGVAYQYLEKFVSEFLSAAQIGGKFTVNNTLSPVFSQMKIIQDLADNLVRLKIDVDRDVLYSQSSAIMRCILEIVEDTKITLKNKAVVNCKMTKIMIIDGKDSVGFCFNTVGFKGGVLIIPDNVAICIPALEVETRIVK